MEKSRVTLVESNLKSTMNLASLKKSMQSMSRLKMRKQSYGFGAVSSIRPVERTSQIAIEFRRPPLLYLNTYQLDPHVPFKTTEVTKAANELLDECFTDHKYNAQESPILALQLAGDLMRKCKAMCFNRYRIIAIVTLAQKRAQSYNNAIAFLWDHERDNYVDMNRETSSAFVQVTVFGIYLD